MSKVLLINGSPRKDGNTFLALSEAAKTLNELGVETEIAWIGMRPVRGCIACGKCHELRNDKCAFDDDICNEMIAKMSAADALVVGSPVYYGQPAGQVLALIQLKNMPLVTSQYWNIVFGMNKGEAKLDVEGMQTMRQLARNMSWLLKNNAASGIPAPQEEEWQPMHFIR